LNTKRQHSALQASGTLQLRNVSEMAGDIS